MSTRREALLTLAALASVVVTPAVAHAAIARGLPLSRLVGSSVGVCVGAPTSALSRWITLGRRRVIVTETQLRVHDTIFTRGTPLGAAVVVRTLGGIVGDVGEIVSGEAALNLDEDCVLFLTAGADAFYVTGMAQGHFPLDPAPHGPRLRASPRLPMLRASSNAAVTTLAGLELPAARDLIQKAQ
jgi:hypothetical protein